MGCCLYECCLWEVVVWFMLLRLVGGLLVFGWLLFLWLVVVGLADGLDWGRRVVWDGLVNRLVLFSTHFRLGCSEFAVVVVYLLDGCLGCVRALDAEFAIWFGDFADLVDFVVCLRWVCFRCVLD